MKVGDNLTVLGNKESGAEIGAVFNLSLVCNHIVRHEMRALAICVE